MRVVFGVAVIDLNNETSSGAVTRTYTAGPGNLTAPWNADATWEIASITKPFTAITALILQQEGLLSLDESTVGGFLDCDWDAANSEIDSVTMMELIQHESGMPAQPPDRGPTIDGNPFANYTVDRLCASLLKLNGLPTRGRYSYSNYAYGLLGYLLTLAVASTNGDGILPDYEDVVKKKILLPLEMYNTSVTFDDAGWAMAAPGCARSISRADEAIRLGEYAALQGNGALRSTLNDMAKYLRVALYVDAGMPTLLSANETMLQFGPLPAPSLALDQVYQALKTAQSLEHRTDLACACVSDWCEGLLCPLPNPNDEFITPGGFEGYHSGGRLGWRKSGDTAGYSSRVAYSYSKGRAAVAVDTCGGCGTKGASGSASQRAALILSDGPPPGTTDGSASNTVSLSAMEFTGDSHSHNFPSVAQVNIEVTPTDDPNTIIVALSSSDGSGGTSNATFAGNGTWLVQSPIFMGTGWGATSDPFYLLPQQRALILSPDLSTATYQDMGADFTLHNKASMPPTDKTETGGGGETETDGDGETETDGDGETETGEATGGTADESSSASSSRVNFLGRYSMLLVVSGAAGFVFE
jgi:CubicO group peptidase (beta-lactamase class C family)